jgi:plastocyanin
LDNGRIGAAILVVLGMAGCLAASPPREIVVLARGMTFVLAEQPDVPNPVIPLRAGERVRIVLRNEAPGLLHDFTIPDWDVEIDQVRDGESGEVVFVVPDRPGRAEYRCRPHAQLMFGFVDVTR